MPAPTETPENAEQALDRTLATGCAHVKFEYALAERADLLARRASG